MNDTQTAAPMLADYTDEITPGWTHNYDGHHFVANSRFGTLEIGVVPGQKWDQWLFHENAGGGSLVIGYTLINDVPNVMMLQANRFNLIGDEDDWELPGGFTDDTDGTKLATAIREMLEDDEAGMLTNPRPIQGRGYIGNRAFFQLNGEHEGTSVFMFELAPEHLLNIAASEGKLALMTWYDAIRITRDALSGMAIGRFIADLATAAAQAEPSVADTIVEEGLRRRNWDK